MNAELDSSLAALPAHDLPAARAEAGFRKLSAALAHERALAERPAWQRRTIRAYDRVAEPLLLVGVSGYYLFWALLNAGLLPR